MRLGPPAAALALAGCLLAAGRASAAEQVYWTNNAGNTIGYANEDGTGDGGELNTTGAAVSAPEGLAMDPDTGRIFWANSGANSISYANMDGSGGGQLNTGAAMVNVPIGLTVDTADDRVYWINAGTGNIAYADADGSGGGGELNTTGASVDDPDGLAIDPSGGRVYWTDYDPGAIEYAALDGSGGGTLDTAPLKPNKPFAIVVNPGDGRVYWSDLGTGDLLYARTDIAGLGGTVLQALLNPLGLAIDPIAGQILWLDGHGINTAGLDGSGAATIPTTGSSEVVPMFLAVVAPPIAAGTPTITGGATAPTQLSCSPGSWAPDAPGDFYYRSPFEHAYRWTLNGAPIAGQTAATLTAAQAGSYACTVTGSNSAGSATETSAAVTVAPAPAAPSPAPTGPATPTTPAPRATRAAPSLTRVRETHRRWAEHRHRATGAAPAPPVGTGFSFTIDQPSRVTLAFSQTLDGRLTGGRCHTGPRAGEHGRRCFRLLVRGELRLTVGAGAHRVAFDGRVPGRTLSPGSYAVSLTATGRASGERSAIRTLRFRIVG